MPVPPGELLREEIESLGMTQGQLAARMGRPSQAINEIIRDKKRITEDTALDLEKALGIPARFWLQLESDYQLTRARLREVTDLHRQERWLDNFPVREMERYGWIQRAPDKASSVRALLEFLGVASFDAWQAQPVAGLRISESARVSLGALSAWLRKGELAGRQEAVAPYDENRFRAALAEARPLTLDPPEAFVPRLKDICASAGVAVVLTRELSRSGASGAARWLGPDRALLQLSLRYKTDDQLWFSFFHEACHVIRHRIRQVFVDGLGGDDGAESEADAFARDFLIDPTAWADFTTTAPRSRAAVVDFAQRMGIAPGIVVGRLQREGVIPYTNLNSLKVRFAWAPPPGA